MFCRRWGLDRSCMLVSRAFKSGGSFCGSVASAVDESEATEVSGTHKPLYEISNAEWTWIAGVSTPLDSEMTIGSIMGTACSIETDVTPLGI